MKHVLRTENLNFTYYNSPVLKNINIAINKGEISFILGANGAGKSTLIKLLCGILSPDNGDIFLEDENMRDISRSEIAKNIAYVSQDSTFGFPFTVKEVVLLGRSPYIGKFGFERDQDLDIADKAMELVGISHLSGRSINKISGGERQLVSVARAIAQQPDIMILDEPGTFLDLRHKSMIYSIIDKLCSESHITVIVATHDVGSVINSPGSAILLKHGQVMHAGKSSEVLTEQNLAEIYETQVKIYKHNAVMLITTKPLN
ncbi:MAG: ATP-binding cassette domain-containing protein [Candidatus Dadabacteria bacterium]|nr:ATP-binding cassette domain-containing protein [Candidatus Dadabacteria bacterium]